MSDPERARPTDSVEPYPLGPRAAFPNNPRLPALRYRNAFPGLPTQEPAAVIERAFEQHGWSNGWRDGVYDYHHFHSTAHEVLGCYGGRAQVQLGGPEGPIVPLERGDVLVLPAGVAHKRVQASADFAVVGAYADGRDYDMQRGDAQTEPALTRQIARVPHPRADPVYGSAGPLHWHWDSELD